MWQDDPGLLENLPAGGRVRGLAGLDLPARQCPLVGRHLGVAVPMLHEEAPLGVDQADNGDATLEHPEILPFSTKIAR
jgi:hypothetical protein